jgi:hypothetical protein
MSYLIIILLNVWALMLEPLYEVFVGGVMRFKWKKEGGKGGIG